LKLSASIFTFFVSINCLAQIEMVPIHRDPIPAKQNKNKSARTESLLPPMSLPFWDDFSFNNSLYYPNDTLWQNSNSVWVNSGEGINPPSLNVATFDGYDFLGKPYSENNPLAKGIADSLTSRTLKLGDVPIALRPSVYISFFYQFTGNGDPPEPGDVLSLLFKNKKNQWKQVWSIENNGTLQQDKFVPVTLPITDSLDFHNNFQFRFQNFGRLSGPYDTWNIDYVYVSNGKPKYAPFYEDIPDRAVASPMTSIFTQYQSIPITHFRTNATSLKYPSVILTNQRKDQLSGQTASYNSTVKIISRKNGTLSSSDSILAKQDSLGFAIKYGQPNPFTFRKLPNLSKIDPLIDSLALIITFDIDTSDNDIKRKVVVNGKVGDRGDYDTAAYKGIDFRHNDTIRSNFILHNYYAYDDGKAEYGAKITGVGTQLAYQFDMKTPERDTVIAVDLYFPKFEDTSSQTIQLQVMTTLESKEPDYPYKQNITVQRNSRDNFQRVPIPQGVPVQGKFYVGWKLNSTAVIAIGLDRNTDSGDKMFVNATGTWEQNTTLKGSLMIRPVFGRPQDPTTGVRDAEMVKPYPNPTQRTFFLPSTAQQIQLYDLSGKEVMFEQNNQFDKKEIIITNPSSGLYVVRYFDQVWRTEKIMVLP
jgi:Secretion system C-terminal sorting domain